MTDKKSIRKEILALRNALDPAVLQDAGVSAADRLEQIAEYENAAEVFVFLSTGREISTDRVIGNCIKAGRKITVPAYNEDTATYRPVRYMADAELERGHKGIMEPISHEYVDLSVIDTVIVPGLAFDLKGGRLGYGSGYYDRMLAEILKAGSGRPLCLIGLALDLQIIESVPMAENDVYMDIVVTEKREIKSAATLL